MLQSDFTWSSHVSRVCNGWHGKYRLSGNGRKNHKAGLTKCWFVKSSLLNLTCPSLTPAFFFKENTFFCRQLSDFCDYCFSCSTQLLQAKGYISKPWIMILRSIISAQGSYLTPSLPHSLSPITPLSETWRRVFGMKREVTLYVLNPDTKKEETGLFLF